MPTFAIVLLIIFAVIFLFFISKVRLDVYYTDKLNVRVRYLFLTFRITKPKPGKTKLERPKLEKIQNKRKKVSLEQIKSFIDIFGRFWNEALELAAKIKNNISIDIFDLELTIGGDDAADTAITYGAVCAAVYPTVSIIDKIIKMRKRKILINANFNSQSYIKFKVKASIRVGILICAGIKSGVKIVLSLLKNPINIKQITKAKENAE